MSSFLTAPITLTREYISPQQTITSAGLLTLAHGMGVTPDFILPYLVCQTAEAGYAVGNTLAIDCVFNDNAATARGQSIRADATNIYVRFGSAAVVYTVIDATTGNGANLTNANWRLVIKALV
jgi:hypothetical protein